LVIQGRSGVRLASEAFKRLLVSGEVSWQKFQRDEASKAHALSLVDYTHPACAELLYMMEGKMPVFNIAAEPLLGELYLSCGQEPVAVGICAHLRRSDALWDRKGLDIKKRGDLRQGSRARARSRRAHAPVRQGQPLRIVSDDRGGRRVSQTQRADVTFQQPFSPSQRHLSSTSQGSKGRRAPCC
jgi:hypothetical protein